MLDEVVVLVADVVDTAELFDCEVDVEVFTEGVFVVEELVEPPLLPHPHPLELDVVVTVELACAAEEMLPVVSSAKML